MANHHLDPYGVGLADRFSVHREALAHRDEIDLLEISTEDYIVRERRTYGDPGERLLREALSAFPCVAHGLSLSIGSVETPPELYLDATKRLLAETGMEVFSEHLAFNNSRNHGYDAIDFLARLPMERVSQMHLAGGHQLPDGRWEDSHSAPVMDEVWPLFDEAVRRAVNARIVILERDSKLKPFESVMRDIRKAREIFYAHRPAELPSREAAPFLGSDDAPPDPLAPEFAGLRSYQRALMGRIARPASRGALLGVAPEAVTEYGLTDPLWFRRLLESDSRSIRHFEESWDCFQKEDEEVAREYQKREWAQWAARLGSR